MHKLFELLLDKSGGIELGGEETPNDNQDNQDNQDNNQGDENHDNDNDVVSDLLNKLSQRVDSIAASLAKDKDTKEVDETLKSSILDAFKEQISGTQTTNQEELTRLQNELSAANETIKGYKLNNAIGTISQKVGINADGVELFSKVLDRTKAFTEKGNIAETEIETQAKAFIEKYPVFSLKGNSFGVNRYSYNGMQENSIPDTKGMSSQKALELYYNN